MMPLGTLGGWAQMARLAFPAWCRHHGPCSRNQSPPYCVQGHLGCERTEEPARAWAVTVPASWGPEQLQGSEETPPPPQRPTSSCVRHSCHRVLANDGGAPPPKLACSPRGSPASAPLPSLCPQPPPPRGGGFPVRLPPLSCSWWSRGLCRVGAENGAKVQRCPQPLAPRAL